MAAAIGIAEEMKQYSLGPTWTGLPDSYSVRDIIGSGSFSKVAAASCKVEDVQELVAIKCCTDIFNANKMPRGALFAFREISILQCLSYSPHVVNLRDVFRLSPETQDLYLVFDQAECDLHSFIHPTAPFPLPSLPSSRISVSELHLIAHQLFKGVQHMHQAQIIHRDLKPQNVLLFNSTEAGAGVVLKICDFGLARKVADKQIVEVSDSSVLAQVTEDGDNSMATNGETYDPVDEELPTAVPKMGRQLTQSILTPNYMCPQFILQPEDYDSSVDLWSCGCILAELLETLEDSGKEPDERSVIFAYTDKRGLMPDPFGRSSGTTDSASGNVSLSEDDPAFDRLKKILTKLGSEGASEYRDGVKLRQYLRSEVAERKANEALADMYRATPQGLVCLLQRLLRLKPERRATAWEAVGLLESSARSLPAAPSFCTVDPSNQAKLLPRDFDSPPEDGQMLSGDPDAKKREFYRIQNSWCCTNLDKIVEEYPSGAKQNKISHRT